MEEKSYAKAGVDIKKGDRFARFISRIQSKAVSREIGGFAGGIEIDTSKYKKPVLLSTTDGVGTKLLVARKLDRYETIGIDLVAMCVNDLIVCGAEPVSFLDYIACGTLDEDLLKRVIEGIITGCEQSECTLSGGETAEMPDMYAPGDIDLAGFCTGLVEKEEMLPKKEDIAPGNLILGLPSGGIHSNGFSLARKCIPEERKELWEELLTPTRIYVKEMKTLLKGGSILGAAHITGGGLAGNIIRILPDGMTPALSWNWETPWIFDEIRKGGNVSEEEMRRVFNMGIGIAIVLKEKDAKDLADRGTEAGINIYTIGKVERG
ncbi:MAG: phosphoribosylformylglycinamidine cyclo-ligase [Spirochaetales bacterium]|nr:phosphoribosylformylglycinamidine cyclo-ligase [Spirochaetales bacterium]